MLFRSLLFHSFLLFSPFFLCFCVTAFPAFAFASSSIAFNTCISFSFLKPDYPCLQTPTASFLHISHSLTSRMCSRILLTTSSLLPPALCILWNFCPPWGTNVPLNFIPPAHPLHVAPPPVQRRIVQLHSEMRSQMQCGNNAFRFRVICCYCSTHVVVLLVGHLIEMVMTLQTQQATKMVI